MIIVFRALLTNHGMTTDGFNFLTLNMTGEKRLLHLICARHDSQESFFSSYLLHQIVMDYLEILHVGSPRATSQV